MDQTHPYNGSLTAEQFLFYEIWIRKASLTTDIVPVTAQIALRIMGIAMEGGIMGMIIHTAVSLAEIKAEADCKAQDENKHTAFRLNVIGGAHG